MFYVATLWEIPILNPPTNDWKETTVKQVCNHKTHGLRWVFCPKNTNQKRKEIFVLSMTNR